MKWQYKRISSNGRATEQFDKLLDELGQDGWELVTSTVVDGFRPSMYMEGLTTIEYIFKKPVE